MDVNRIIHRKEANSMETNTILQGDALDMLRTLPSGSVNCVVTSPPY